MEWYLKVVKNNYANFSGRARRAEFWYFFLIYVLIYVALSLLAATLIYIASLFGSPSALVSVLSALGFIISILRSLFSLAMFIPSIAVGIRRLHDTGRSGWWLLIGLVPLIGTIVLIVFFAQDGSFDRNEYGPSPKKAPAV